MPEYYIVIIQPIIFTKEVPKHLLFDFDSLAHQDPRIKIFMETRVYAKRHIEIKISNF